MMDDMQNRIAIGLRRMTHAPDALLFIDGILEETWDLPTAFEYAVFHTYGMANPYAAGETIECPFLPLWKGDFACAPTECRRFVAGYCE